MVTGEGEAPTVREFTAEKKNSSLNGSDCCTLFSCPYFEAISNFPDRADGKGSIWRCMVQLFTQVTDVKTNGIAFTSSGNIFPYLLVNLIISQNPSFIDSQQKKNLKFFMR